MSNMKRQFEELTEEERTAWERENDERFGGQADHSYPDDGKTAEPARLVERLGDGCPRCGRAFPYGDPRAIVPGRQCFECDERDAE
jgi:hypothetical protein